MEHFSRLLERIFARDASVSAADITRPYDAIVKPVEVHGGIGGSVTVGKIGKIGRANAPESFDAVGLTVETAAAWRSVSPPARRGVGSRRRGGRPCGEHMAARCQVGIAGSQGPETGVSCNVEQNPSQDIGWLDHVRVIEYLGRGVGQRNGEIGSREVEFDLGLVEETVLHGRTREDDRAGHNAPLQLLDEQWQALAFGPPGVRATPSLGGQIAVCRFAEGGQVHDNTTHTSDHYWTLAKREAKQSKMSIFCPMERGRRTRRREPRVVALNNRPIEPEPPPELKARGFPS